MSQETRVEVLLWVVLALSLLVLFSCGSVPVDRQGADETYPVVVENDYKEAVEVRAWYAGGERGRVGRFYRGRSVMRIPARLMARYDLRFKVCAWSCRIGHPWVVTRSRLEGLGPDALLKVYASDNFLAELFG